MVINERVHPIKLDGEERKLYESTNRQYLDQFPKGIPGNPKQAFETCDAHLELKQTIRMIDPRGNGLQEGTWNEPIDNLEYWRNKARIAWLLIGICSIIFFLVIYYWRQ